MSEVINSIEMGLGRIPNDRSLNDLVYNKLKRAIVTHQLEAGKPLVEADVATLLGVSKTPVRAALQRLELERFVERVPYSGTRVAELSPADVREIYEVRSALEGLAVTLATPLYTSQDIEHMKALLSAAEDALAASDIERARDLGSEWHAYLTRPSSNKFLRELLRMIESHVERSRTLTSRDLDSAKKSVQEHWAVLEAIEARQPELAERLLKIHLVRVDLDFESSEAPQRA